MFLALIVAGANAQDKPNVLLIYVDDLGYGDLGCYGGKIIPTPHIDQLANQGVRFTNGYVVSPVCGPSRLSLLSGSYPQRYGVYWNNDLWDRYGFKVPENQKLLTETFRDAGYATAMVGKWNITENDASKFVDESYDVMNWKGAYYPEEDGSYLGVNGPEFKNEIMEWGPRRPSDEYLTDRLTRRASEFMQRHQKDPFFLYLAYNAPHSPYQADKKYDALFASLDNQRDRIYAGMVASLDENIGKVMRKLKELDLEKNTLIVFISDNGPADRSDGQLNSAGPLKGKKANHYEGGIRIPFILKFPNMHTNQSPTDAVVNNIDIYPTLCAAAGLKIPEGTVIDGMNLLPYLQKGFKNFPERILYWKNYKSGAMRQGDLKLVVSGEKKELYNLARDPGEVNNLAKDKPEVLKQMHDKWSLWLGTLPKSLSK